jgi:biopolymer transport protein ExbB/TolQ
MKKGRFGVLLISGLSLLIVLIIIISTLAVIECIPYLEVNMRKPKTSLELLKRLRNIWTLNPITRIAENEHKNIKKIRQKAKNEEKQQDDENN